MSRFSGLHKGAGALFTDTRETLKVTGISQYVVDGIIMIAVNGAIGTEHPQTGNLCC